MLEIKELIIRVPGYNEEEARSLGQEVARQVTDGLPVQLKDRLLGTIDFRVSAPPGTSRRQMSALIAEAILKGLI